MFSAFTQGDFSVLDLLEEMCSAESRQEVALKLVKIFLGQGLAVTFLDKLNMREVNRTGEVTLADPPLTLSCTQVIAYISFIAPVHAFSLTSMHTDGLIGH